MTYYVLIDGRVFDAKSEGELRSLLNLFKEEGFPIRIKEGIFYNNEVSFANVRLALEYYERKWKREADSFGYKR